MVRSSIPIYGQPVRDPPVGTKESRRHGAEISSNGVRNEFRAAAAIKAQL